MVVTPSDVILNLIEIDVLTDNDKTRQTNTPQILFSMINSSRFNLRI